MAAKRQADKRYHVKHRDKRNAYTRTYYAANKHRWYDPEGSRVRAQRRRALLLGARVDYFTRDDLFSAWDAKGLSGCAYCEEGAFEHVDHVVPLSRGGVHSISNLLPACANCNLSKGSKLLEEWRLPG